MATRIAPRLDALVGDTIEGIVRLHHRRRLTRLGWGRIYRSPSAGAPFAEGDPPPRPGCELTVLVDGAAALPEMARAIAGARRYVHVTGWHIAPGFELMPGQPGGAIGTILAEAAERVDVRVLVWAGSPARIFHPTRAEVSRALDQLTRDTRIQAHPDPREHPIHCHHEKTIVIDGELAFVGGIDLTDSAGDRYDDPGHPARRRIGWHDVATRLRGPAVADVDDHFRTRWRELTGETLPAPPPGRSERSPAPPTGGSERSPGQSTVQVVRTVAEGMYDALPHGDFRVYETYVRTLSAARELIYIENQFLWAPEIVSIIADKLRHPPTPGFRVVIVLPVKPNNGAEDTRGQLGVLIDADGDQHRLLAATIRAMEPAAPRTDRVYVHAKVAVVDDRWLIVGSANLNAHSMFNDTEMCVVTDDAALARDTRVRLWAEHLEMDAGEVAAADPAALVDERWWPIAHEQLRRDQTGEPPTHRLIELPGVSRRAGRLMGPLAGLMEDS